MEISVSGKQLNYTRGNLNHAGETINILIEYENGQNHDKINLIFQSGHYALCAIYFDPNTSIFIPQKKIFKIC